MLVEFLFDALFQPAEEVKFLRDGIPAAGGEGVAAANAPKRQKAALDRTEAADSSKRILGAAWCKAAGTRQSFR